MNYKIASLDSKDFERVKKAEELIKNETNKDYVLIAWEKTK